MNESFNSLDSRFVEILEKALDKEELSKEEGERLLEASDSEVDSLVKVADKLRREEVGNTVTYVINRNINFTNICKNSCKFCAFNTEQNNLEAYTLSPEEVAKRTSEAVKKGATEICLQGGLNPSLSFEDYLEYLEALRSVSSDIHIHAYSPAEIDFMSKKSNLGIEEIIRKLKDTGLNSVPGTAAEILTERVRKIICPKKISVRQWEEIIKTCHNLDVPTTATIMYGHIEKPEEIVSHLIKIREIQQETNGFTELVPLAFASQNTELEKDSKIKKMKPEDHLKIHAVCRLMLINQIKNIQTSWVKLGPKLAQRVLNAGANDFSGTLMEENITRAAGGELQELRPGKIKNLISEINRTPKQRTTTYDILTG